GSGCMACAGSCPFGAIEESEWTDPANRKKVKVARVVESVCHGCGSCVVTCRSGAPDIAGFSNEQIFEQVEVA
ncbi:MAG TPA: 4Fe-4S dicluster domain-containing protein, partial [Candidatus Acetothermia bacterium]|nr:4Fe-4S dicluster domain-containing protein [Candidatus Acetothermia bacterium]